MASVRLTMSAIVRVDRLGYAYPGGSTPVLRGLDFEIEEGEIFGFLGPNGSGKSTTQKLLTRILHGYEGAVQVFGSDLAEQGAAYHESVGVSFEIPNLYGKLTARENLDFYASFFSGDTESSADLLSRLDLTPEDPRRVDQYSKGMKMRVVLARSLLNRPRLWFLDEPTSGQDPEHARKIRDLIRDRAAGGATVFLTTHDMTLADELCDRIALLADGEIAAVGRPDDLKLEQTTGTVRVEIRDGDGLVAHEFSLGEPSGKRAFAEFVAANDVVTIHTQEPSLEDVFLRTTGKGLLG